MERLLCIHTNARSSDDRQADTVHGGRQQHGKAPSTWVTGDEAMTGAQRSYLKTLSEEAKEPYDVSLTKAQASVRIDELQQLTGRAPPDHKPATDREE